MSAWLECVRAWSEWIDSVSEAEVGRGQEGVTPDEQQFLLVLW